MSTISASTTSTTAFKITTDTTGTLVFQTGSSPTTAVTIDSSGKLLLNTTTLNTYTANINGTLGVYGGSGLFLQNSSNNAAVAIYNGGGTGVSQIQFNTSGSEQMRLDASGNLGLGVTPSAWVTLKGLEIAGLGNSVAGYPADAGMYVSSNAYYGTGGWRYGYSSKLATLYSAEAGVHKWSTAGSGTAGNAITFTQAMTLDASGRLAIGSTSVTNGTAFGGGSQVNVAKVASSGYPCFQISTTSGGGASVQFTNSDTVNGVIGYNASGGTNEFSINNVLSGTLVLATNNTERARIDTSGNLLVGTTSFTTGGIQKTVVVSGASSAGFQLAASGAVASYIYWYSTTGFRVETTTSYPKVEFAPGGSGGVQLASAGATSWTSLSDESTKTDLLPITGAVQKVSLLRSVTGRFKTDAEEKRRAFLIAQDVQSVLPEAVNTYTEKDGTEYLGLAYTDTIPLLVAAIKELNTRLEAVENK